MIVRVRVTWPELKHWNYLISISCGCSAERVIERSLGGAATSCDGVTSTTVALKLVQVFLHLDASEGFESLIATSQHFLGC